MTTTTYNDYAHTPSYTRIISLLLDKVAVPDQRGRLTTTPETGDIRDDQLSTIIDHLTGRRIRVSLICRHQSGGYCGSASLTVLPPVIASQQLLARLSWSLSLCVSEVVCS